MPESDELPAVPLARASARACVSLCHGIYSSFPVASPVLPYRRACLSQHVQRERGLQAPVFMTREVSRHKQQSILHSDLRKTYYDDTLHTNIQTFFFFFSDNAIDNIQEPDFNGRTPCTFT